MSGIAQALFMGYGQGSSWTPASLFASSPMEQGAWYDPSDLTTMWTDDGVTQAGVNDLVYRIDDKSGNGNHAYQTTEAARPILRQSGGLYYLDFDGSDDFIEAGPLDQSAYNEATICAGVTKNSDAAAAQLFENTYDSSGNGYIGVQAPNSTTNKYRTLSKGSTPRAANATAAEYAAPVTNVVTGRGKISTNVCVIRIDGTDVQSVTDSQGSVNYGSSAPFYIGCRNGNSLYLNGDVYQVIVRLSIVSGEDLTNLESFVAGKTGVTL